MAYGAPLECIEVNTKLNQAYITINVPTEPNVAYGAPPRWHDPHADCIDKSDLHHNKYSNWTQRGLWRSPGVNTLDQAYIANNVRTEPNVAYGIFLHTSKLRWIQISLYTLQLVVQLNPNVVPSTLCLLYTSDAADE